MICQWTDPDEKAAAVRLVLEALPEWFGIAQAREGYIRESRDYPLLSTAWLSGA